MPAILGTAGGLAAAGAAASAAGSIGGALISSSATSAASTAQQATSLAALASQNADDAQDRQNTAPFINAGINASAINSGLVSGYNDAIQPYQNALAAATPGNFDQNALAQTPGYKFTLEQGLKAAQSAAAARGLGVSGAALRGAADYATQLSNQTYNPRFDQAPTEYGDASNNLLAARTNYQGLANMNALALTTGESAAVNQGSQNQQSAQNSGNLLTGLGNAQGSAALASANKLSGGITGATNALTGLANNPQFYNALAGAFSGNGSQYPSSATGNPDSNNYNPENGY